ncbi:MAG: site-specific DNA-methyltransferase [candidate division Zixibacteria bacterium]|nr:site-specific DNA-methyltransferase [Candidatus Tariuqbacter arcticus]
MNNNEIKTSVIYCGDCLKHLKNLPDDCIDLIYIDPPFNSNRNYEVFWGDTKEKRAFEDRFGDAEHYVNWMTPRLVQIVRILKLTGSFYYHCDWHASHYMKIKLDQMFGFSNFRSEIMWERAIGTGSSKSIAKHFGHNNDSIFFFTKGKKYTFHRPRFPYSEDYIKSKFVYSDERGQYRLNVLATYSKERFEQWQKEGRIVQKPDSKYPYYKQYLDESPGVALSNIWTDIEPIISNKGEGLGYPTQKPIKLLERIIKASSNPDDIILDAFCGCGTTIVAAQQLGRKWIGIDISPTACRVMAKRLKDVCGLKEGVDFVIRDLPKTWEELKKYPPFEFQNWAINALGGIPSAKKVGDMGIDGYIYPAEDVSMAKNEGSDLFGELDKRIPVQVKQHRAGRPDIDSFETAIRRDKRNLGFFVALTFTKDATREIDRVKREEDLTIIPFTVQQILDEEAKINDFV